MKVYSKKDVLNNVYEYDKRVNQYKDRLKKMNTKNSKIAIDYFESYLKNNGFAVATQVKWFSRTVILCEWFKKDFNKCTKKDIEKVVEEKINKNNDLTPDSKKMYKLALKKLFRYIKKCDNDTYPPEVSWIRTPRNESRKNIDPEDLINDDDIEKMVKAADHPRDKAFLICLAEFVVGVKGVEYNKDIFEPECDRDNLINVLQFSEKIILDKKSIPGFQREKIDEFKKWDLFTRYALDNLAGLMLGAPKDNDLFQRFISKEIIPKLKDRINEVRNSTPKPNFSKSVE